jgi:hypothetical protein
MDSQIFRPVAHWEGSATVRQDGQAHDVWLKVLVVRQVTADGDGAELDNGHRIWTARVSGPALMVGAEVTVTLSQGEPIGARVLSISRSWVRVCPHRLTELVRVRPCP